jgi:glycosyltransferase involved in cell wall biosynthesis
MVSVIITTFNRRSYVKPAVESVLAQDYADMEVLVVDDGSDDGSPEEAAGLPVRYVRKENGGISSARNAGIALAQGDYIAFLDVDDLWKADKLSMQMSRMREAGALISYTDEVWIRNGRRVNQGRRHRKYSGMIYEHCLPLCIISPSSVVIHRSVFEDVGTFDESMPVCEDYDLWLRIACRYPVLFIPKPLIIKHGGHEDQLSRAYEGMDRFRIDSMARMLENGALTPLQREATARELARKCRVYADGACKRGKTDEAEYYRALPGRFAAPAAKP